MVIVTETTERATRTTVTEEDDGFVTDSGSEGSIEEVADTQEDSDDDEEDLAMAAFDPSTESYADRFYALRDMISPRTRIQLSNASTQAVQWGRKGWTLAGNGAWVVITSAILLGLPLALAVEGETMFVQQEKFEREQLQGQQMMLPQGQAGSEPTGVVPPGF